MNEAALPAGENVNGAVLPAGQYTRKDTFPIGLYIYKKLVADLGANVKK